MKGAHRCLVAIALAIAIGPGCKPTEPPPVDDPAPSGPNSADSAWAEVVPAVDATLLEAPAHVVTPPDGVAEIAPVHRFHVQRVAVRPGDVVEAGTVLVEGTSPDLLDAAAAIRVATSRAQILGKRRDRLAELRKEGLIEQSRVFDLEVSLAEAEGQRLRAAATLRAAGFTVADAARLTRAGSDRIALTSPIAGTVRSVSVVVGQVREPGAGAMVTVVGTGPVRIEARLPGPVPPEARFEMVVHEDQVVDLGDVPPNTLVLPEDGTTLAWWDPPPTNVPLSPGLRGRVRGRVTDPDLRQIPSAALRITDGKASVLRRLDDGSTESVPVDVVVSSGTSAIVRGPLRLHDTVAADVSLVLPPPEVTE